MPDNTKPTVDTAAHALAEMIAALEKLSEDDRARVYRSAGVYFFGDAVVDVVTGVAP